MNEMNARVGVHVDPDGAVSANVALDGACGDAEASVWRDANGNVQVRARVMVNPPGPIGRLPFEGRTTANGVPIAEWRTRLRDHWSTQRKQWWEEDLRPFSILGSLRDVTRTALVFVLAFVLLGTYVAVVHPGYLRNEPLPKDLYEHVNMLFSAEAMSTELAVAGVVLTIFCCIPVLRRHVRVLADHVVTVLCSAGAFYAVFMAFGRAYHIPNVASPRTIVVVSGMFFVLAFFCNSTIAVLSDTINDGARKRHLGPE